jgi:hypothetical protein
MVSGTMRSSRVIVTTSGVDTASIAGAISTGAIPKRARLNVHG